MLVTLINYSDLVDRNICYFFVLVTQIKHAVLYIDHVSTKRCIRAAGDVDLLAEKLSQ